ncbi:MAG TPA: LptA/OstA family protein [Silvibacterium sp.]|nr:LptA/OstA family protein [Silvibacterium sp.]
MSLTIARLRQGILLLAGVLVAVLSGFFVYACYRLRHFEKDLPARLGVNIEQTANGYTYSQSSKGHTLYTIHAAKLIQYKEGGNATLHDVAITLFGPEGSNRTDRISGSEFNYDAGNQTVSAQGAVSIDLQGFGGDGQGPSRRNDIHVKANGLVFDQKTGQADTGQHTEFSFPKAAGSATGAHYNSKTGVLVLDSQVEIEMDDNGTPAMVHASHAQVARDSMQAFLLNPRTDFKAEQGSADSAIISFRQDGSIQNVNAQGHVRIVSANGAVITAFQSETQLNQKSQPIQSEMTGGMTFASTSADESMHGTAVSGTLTFAADAALKHAQFRDAVSFVDQVFRLANDPKGTASRQIQTSKLDVDFVRGASGQKSVAEKALATGDASVNLHTIPSKGAQQVTTISGDQLLALLTADGKAIRQLNGAGHTKIIDLAKDGSSDTSIGDRLEVAFDAGNAEAPRSRSRAKGESSQTGQASRIETATQDGHVMLTQMAQTATGAAAGPATLTAWAQHAEYHASDEVLRLTGNPRLTDGQSLQMAAADIDYHRDSGDAIAVGNVKATYTQQKKPKGTGSAESGPAFGGDGPMHITADHALLRRETKISTFYGAGAVKARMWQGADSILAPVIELSRTPETLKANGAADSDGAVVEANLTSVATPNRVTPNRKTSVMRVHSRTLFYSDADRRGDFHGEVTAQNPSGVIHADDAQIFLTPAAKSNGGQQTTQLQLDRIVAMGDVVLTQPGRKGTGERLVYTAGDGRYVLTGSPGNPPRAEDAVRGTTTGSTLIFNSQDDSVVVSGGQSGAVTQTRTPK